MVEGTRISRANAYTNRPAMNIRACFAAPRRRDRSAIPTYTANADIARSSTRSVTAMATICFACSAQSGGIPAHSEAAHKIGNRTRRLLNVTGGRVRLPTASGREAPALQRASMYQAKAAARQPRPAWVKVGRPPAWLRSNAEMTRRIVSSAALRTEHTYSKTSNYNADRLQLRTRVELH
jgi:hypothetical protein